LHNCLNITSRLIRTLALRMAEELETPGLASVELIDALGTSLQIEVARYILDSPSHLDTSRGGLTRGAYRKIIARIEADAPPPTLEQLALLAGLSKRHLTRAFRESTGLTVAQMIDEARYKRGVSLLRDPDIRIAEVSTRLGFRSSASFSRAFRRWSGQSPRRFRHSQKRSLEDGKQMAARPHRDGPPAE
jgi:AraC family transcriptional regulator